MGKKKQEKEALEFAAEIAFQKEQYEAFIQTYGADVFQPFIERSAIYEQAFPFYFNLRGKEYFYGIISQALLHTISPEKLTETLKHAEADVLDTMWRLALQPVILSEYGGSIETAYQKIYALFTDDKAYRYLVPRIPEMQELESLSVSEAQFAKARKWNKSGRIMRAIRTFGISLCFDVSRKSLNNLVESQAFHEQLRYLIMLLKAEGKEEPPQEEATATAEE